MRGSATAYVIPAARVCICTAYDARQFSPQAVTKPPTNDCRAKNNEQCCSRMPSGHGRRGILRLVLLRVRRATSLALRRRPACEEECAQARQQRRQRRPRRLGRGARMSKPVCLSQRRCGWSANNVGVRSKTTSHAGKRIVERCRARRAFRSTRRACNISASSAVALPSTARCSAVRTAMRCRASA